ncbi:tetratricopeptide repeat protein [Kangiella sediminilitoris]|uniref:Tetratricopeptide repeat protein n=1 Tax=Kangiella sediminilitoris TaxID=1144748 RepID=A0A1B3B9V2_9GAMM|nr:hypothetical protein [Kangiella sediminilitoris]AOE49590.1 hypothetical protein KS2013_868 [Kangiella sediminilitoris]
MNNKLCKLLLVFIAFTFCELSSAGTIEEEIKEIKSLIDQDNISERKYTQVKQKLDAISDTAADNPRYWVQKARYELGCGFYSPQCEKKGMWERALKDINTAKKIAPNDIEVLSLSGHVLRNLKRYDKAITDLEKALSIDSSHAWANLNYAATIDDMAYGMGVKFNDDEFMERRYQKLSKGLNSLKVVLEGDYADREKKAAIFKCDKLANWMRLEDRLYCHKVVIELDHFDNLKEKAWANGNYSLQLLKAEKYSEAKEYAENAIALMDYPIARLMLSASYLGLWYEGGYQDETLFDKAYETYERNELDPIFELSARMDDIQFFKKLQEKGVDLNGYDSYGSTLLSKSLIYNHELKEKNYERVEGFVTELNLKIDQPFYVRSYSQKEYRVTNAIESLEKRIDSMLKVKYKHRDNTKLSHLRDIKYFLMRHQTQQENEKSKPFFSPFTDFHYLIMGILFGLLGVLAVFLKYRTKKK